MEKDVLSFSRVGSKRMNNAGVSGRFTEASLFGEAAPQEAFAELGVAGSLFQDSA
jgi:hypothetical protein